MRGESRHSAIEYLVFALALTLMLLLGYQGVKRVPSMLARWRGGQEAPAQYRSLVGREPAPDPAPGAVDYVAAVKVIPGGGGKKKIVSVPPPVRR
jgi:hypothetical protein